MNICSNTMLIYAVLLLISFGSSAVAVSTTPNPPDNKGTEFVLMFMENKRLGGQIFPLEIYCTTQSVTPVNVHVTSPKSTSPSVDATFTVSDGQVHKVIIDAAFRMTGSGVDTKAIRIQADAEVACYGANKETLSNDVYLGLPVDALGTDYYTMTHSPPADKTEFGLAATADGTDVTVTLPSGNGPVDVTFQSQTYHAGDVIHVHLDKYDTLQIQSSGDLTGTHVESTKPVAAFSGNVKTNVGNGTFADHLVEQLVPSDRWGQKFVTAPIPDRTVGDVFKIVAKLDGTVVTIPGKGAITLNKGDTYEFELPSNQYNYITSTNPIMLAQFVKSQQNATEPADPSMMLIPPYEQFGSDYTFTTPEYSHPEYGNNSIYRYKNEFMIVAKKSDIGGLLLDGKPFPQTRWVDIPNTNLVGSFVTLPHGPHTVRHSDPLSTFGGYLYGHAYHESYGFPTGMRTAIIYNPNCTVTPSVAGDGIDNDCDNKIDEELCTPDNHGNDDDNDGRIDEDCVKTTPIDGFWGKWGPWGSTCSVTCGDGVLTRTRLCDSPTPKFGGKNCTGTDQDTKTCYGGTPCGLDVTSLCNQNSRAIVANPLNCAQYFDCSRTSTLGQPHLFECPYPDLFNNNTMQCDNFENVNCGRRMEPMDPCDYKQNKCNGSDPSCPPCRDRWMSCVGVTDGRQPKAVFTPEYKDCKKNRTMAQGKCEFGFFDTRTHACVNHNPVSLRFYCVQHPTEKQPEPNNCAKYYDCSKTGNTLADRVAECTYPDLFSTVTGQCEDFTTVKCTPRLEPEAPCEYDQYKCASGNSTCKPCPQVHADCRGLANGNQSWPGKQWGPDFADCYLNRTMSQGHCTTGYYHPVLKKCMDTVKPSEVNKVCSANPTMILQDDQDCAKYINCSAATTLLGNHYMECTYPDLFSTKTQMCGQFENVACDKRPEPMAPCEYDQYKCASGNSTCKPCPQVHADCRGLANGNQSWPGKQWGPDFADCYLNRTMSQGHCTTGYYHLVLKKCMDTVKPSEVSNVCSANPTMILQDDQDCAKYINCSAATTLLGNHYMECTYPDLFSTKTQMCGQFENVACDKRPEPMAPCEYDQNTCAQLQTVGCKPCPSRLPSCIGKQDGDQPFPGQEWTDKFIHCYKNRTLTVDKCPAGSIFDPNAHNCTTKINKNNIDSFCQTNPTAVKKNPSNCAQYYNCSDNQSKYGHHLEECPYPDLFSTTTMTCQKFESVSCKNRNEPEAPCDYMQNLCPASDPACKRCPERLPSCIGLPDGDQPFPSRQWKPDYVTCYKNRTVIPTKQCSKGYFHPVHKNCTEQVAKPDAMSYCQANPHDVVPMMDNCAHFIDCDKVLNGGTSDPVSECTYPDLFSDVSRTCQAFTTVHCDKRLEPQAPCEYDQNLCQPNNASCAQCPLRLPSCIGLQDGAQPFPTHLWSRDYVQCYKNRTVAVKKCVQGTIFDPINQGCVSDVPRAQIPSYCQANPSAIKADPANCARYFNCSQANAQANPPLGPYEMECTYPDLFSPTLLKCRPFDSVSCTSRMEPKAPCEYAQNLCAANDTSCVPCPDRLPSCVGVPDGDQPFPSRTWKPDYVTCNKDRTISVNKCTTGYYNPYMKMCMDTVLRPDAKPYCQANPTAILPLVDNCAEYINCTAYVNGQVSDPVQECPYPQLYDTSTSRCADFHSVSCGSRPEPMSPCQYHQNEVVCSPTDPYCEPCPDRLPSCVGLSDGNHPFPSRLWKSDYITCYQNRTVIPTKTCVKGYYHPINNTCTEKITPTDATPYCQANPRDMLPMSSNCAKYYNCAAPLQGHSVIQECNYPDLFSTLSMTCQDFTTVTCGNRPEPEAPCQYDQNLCRAGDSSCEPCPDRLPSCVGQTDGDEPDLMHQWTDVYVRCYRNRTMRVQHCPKGAVFSPDKLACITKIGSGDIASYCHANPKEVRPHESNCAQYYNCSNPNTRYGNYLQECEYPDLFSTVTRQCEQFESVACGTRNEPQPPCEYLQNLCNGSDPSCTPCQDRLPSCVGLPDGKNTVPGREWTPDYMQCYKNRTVSVDHCNTKYFHPITRVCTDTVKKPDVQSFCQKNPGVILAADDNCAQFYNCSAPMSRLGAYVQECNYPDLFSSYTMTCGDFTRTLCGSRTEPQAPCEYEANLCVKGDPTCVPCPDRLPSCRGLPDGAQPDSTHLWGKQYIECFQNRTMTVRNCTHGYFHPRQKQCRDVVQPVDVPDYCTAHSREVIANPDNCAVYFDCTQPANNITMECTYPDLFDKATKSCQSFEQVDCQSRPEPMAPCQYKQNLCGVNDPGCIPCPTRLPSCVGQADGNQPDTAHLFGTQFVTCYKNRTTGVDQCNTGYFHPQQRRCVTKVPKSDISSYCDAHPRAVIPYPDNCAQYVNCSLMTPSTIPIQECTYPDLFSSDTLTCVTFTSVTCDTRMEPQAPCEYGQNQCAPGDSMCTPCPDRLPSCVGTADGAQPFTGRLWSENYIECYKNRTMSLDKCPTGSVFQPYQKSCVSTIDKNAVQSFCQANSHAVKEHPDNCAQYYNCSQPGSPLGPFLMECDYPDLFSSKTMTCVDFEKAQCGSKTEPKYPCDYLKNLCSAQDPNCVPCSTRLPGCETVGDGNQPYPGKAWEADYINCYKNRTISEQKCQRGYFHPQKRICVQSINPANIVSYCQAHPGAVMTDPSNCARYFNCSDPQSPLGPYIEECVYPELFSEIYKTCVPFENVNCQNRLEPVAPCDYLRNQCDPNDPLCVPCTQRFPSCNGLPDGKNPFPGASWKPDYVVCRKNRTESVERCPSGEYFNPRTKTCEKDVQSVDIVPYCTANRQDIVPRLGSCSQYYICNRVLGNQATVEECQYPDLFSRTSLSCEQFETVDCDKRPEPQAPCDYARNLCPPNDGACIPCGSRLSSCVGLQDGYQKIAGQEWDSQFVECKKNRTMSIKQCPKGAFFNSQEKRCTQNINTGDIDSFCQAHPTAILPHPTNCAQYYDCSAVLFNGGEQLKECPYPDLFDATSLTCEQFTQVQCGARYEPRAPCDYKANQCSSSSQTDCIPCTQRQPSCVGLDDGNQPFTGLLWQQQYVVCYKNRTTTVSRCPSTQIFNPNTRTCMEVANLTQPEIQNYCQSHPNMVIADPDDCSRFYECRTGGVTGSNHAQCTYPMLFSDVHGTCEDFNQVDCHTRMEPTSPCEYDHNKCSGQDPGCVPCTSRMPNCKGLPDGDNGINGMLWSLNYVRCQKNRTLEVKTCPSGVFDPNIRSCNNHIDPAHVNDLCTANPQAIVPHPTNCAQYFDCTMSKTQFGHYLMECQYPMLFDEPSLTCKHYDQVQCGAKAEPQAPCQYFQNLCPSNNNTCTPCPDRLPSCVGLPDGLNSVPGRAWSAEYMTCRHNRTLAFHRCPNGVFDPQQRACSQSVQPVDIPEYCKSNTNAMLPDPTNCARFYDCKNSSNGYHHECVYPDLYNEQKGRCEDFKSVSCDAKPEPQTPCEYRQNLCLSGDINCTPCPQRLPSCKGLPDGINGYPARPWSDTYVQCLQNRTMGVQHCRQGIFNPLSKQCVKDVDPTNIDQICSANPSAKFPDQDNCAKYYDCQARSSLGQNQYHEECAYPSLYSRATSSCENFTTVYCDTRSEPQAPCEYDENLCQGSFGCRPCPERTASCKGLPDGYNSYPGQPWSSDYIFCLKNRTLSVHACDNGLKFDPAAKKCTQYVDPAQIDEYCKVHPQAVLPNTQDAAQYFDCSLPQSPLGPYKHECNYPDLFDVRSLQCSNFTSVPTDQRPEPQAPCEYETNRCPANDPQCTPCPQRLHSCVGLPDGPNAIEGRQWSADYVQCKLNRTLGTGHCSQGVFDPNQRSCQVQTTPASNSIADQCRQDPNRLLSDMRSCALYYNCSKTSATLSPLLSVHLQECEYPKLFSTVYQQCLDFQYVQCENRHEVQAPCQYLENQCDTSDPACLPCPERLPSCIGLPDGNNPVIGRYWSPDYIYCYKNRTLGVDNCQTGYFNPNTRKCSNDVNNGNLGDYCRNHPTEKVANSNNCAQYFDCSKSTFRIGIPLLSDNSYNTEECQYPDLFSTVTGRCEPFEKVHCDDRNEPQAPCEYDQNVCPSGDSTCSPCPTRLPSCVGLPDGLVGIPGQEYTDRYLECKLNRTLAVNHCNEGFFDAGLHMCVNKINSANIVPYCQRNPGAILPHPTNCAWYYNCSVNGITRQSVYPFDIEYVQECDYPDLFSAATMRCESFPSVSCDGHFEPQAPCEYFKNRCDPTEQSCIPCPNRLPSCKTLPDGKQVITNLYDNLQYLAQCDTNRTMSYKVCSPGSVECLGVPVATTPAPYIAPPTTHTMTTTMVTQPQGICDINRGRSVGNPNHCGQYYNCTRLTPPYLFECQYPDMFSEFTGRCEKFQTVTCGTRTEYKTPCDYDQNLCPINDRTCTPCDDRLPSCLYLPDGDQAYPGRLDTPSYVTCLQGRTMNVAQCQYGVFDQYQRRCSQPTTHIMTSSVQPDNVDSYCSFHPNALLPVPDKCAQYYNCSIYNTRLGHHRDECVYPLVFDTSTSSCRDNAYVNCGRRTKPGSTCDYELYECIGVGCPSCNGQQAVTSTLPPPPVTTQSSTPSCTGKPEGLNPYPGRELTGYYIVCENGQMVETGICIIDKILDPVRRRCTYPADQDVIGPYCKANPGSYIPSVTQCAQYYQCGTASNGYSNVLRECPYPQLFSTVDNTCKAFRQVQCGQRSEPITPCEYSQFQCSTTDINCIPCDQKVPSCQGLPDGLNPATTSYQSPEYITCDMGRTISTSTCGSGYFNSASRQCTNTFSG